MLRELVQTEDGSHSLFVPSLNEQYHSRHGAIQESRHVFLKMGLAELAPRPEKIRILEIGFGTGLNAILTAMEAAKHSQHVDYMGIEAYPLSLSEWSALNYAAQIGAPEVQGYWERIHAANWEQATTIHPYFQLLKVNAKIEDFPLDEAVDLIYFDAFAPEKQPELWTEAIFQRMFGCLNSGGILVTYCAKGAVRRAMLSAGFQVERVPGPPGKREMLRARKP